MLFHKSLYVFSQSSPCIVTVTFARHHNAILENHVGRVERRDGILEWNAVVRVKRAIAESEPEGDSPVNRRTSWDQPLQLGRHAGIVGIRGFPDQHGIPDELGDYHDQDHGSSRTAEALGLPR